MLPVPTFSFNHVHPILVNFTAALFPASVGSDLLSRLLGRRSLGHAAWWMVLFAAIVTPATVVAGLFWRREVGQFLSPEIINTHQWLGISLSVFFILVARWRGKLHACEESPGIAYFVTVSIVALALVYQGTLGGMMVFGK
jgi:uncharacterized membrane protein